MKKGKQTGKFAEMVNKAFREVSPFMTNGCKKKFRRILASYLYSSVTYDTDKICRLIGIRRKKLYKWMRSPRWGQVNALWHDIGPKPGGKKRSKSCKRHKPLLFARQKGICSGCGDYLRAHHLTIDHIVPLGMGGTNHIRNLQLLCYHCNNLKHNHSQSYLFKELRRLGINKR